MSEVVEHVANLKDFIKNSAKLLKVEIFFSKKLKSFFYDDNILFKK